MARAKGRRRVCGVRGHESKAHETVQHRERGVNRRLVRSRRGSSHSANYEGEIRTRNERTACDVASPMMRPMPNAVFIAPYWGTPTWAPDQRSSQGGGKPLLLRKKGRSGLVVWWGRLVGFRCSSCLPPLLLVLLFFNGNLFSLDITCVVFRFCFCIMGTFRPHSSTFLACFGRAGTDTLLPFLRKLRRRALLSHLMRVTFSHCHSLYICCCST